MSIYNLPSLHPPRKYNFSINLNNKFKYLPM